MTMSNEESSKQSSVSKWRQRLQNEADHGPKIFIDDPLDTDVLLGKHRDAFNHVGNRSFRNLIQDHWERYNNAVGRCERTAIVVQIVDFLREQRQVRFLKRDNSVGGWYIVHDSVAREKVGHAIRDAINFRRHNLRKMIAEGHHDQMVHADMYSNLTDEDPPQCQSEGSIPVWDQNPGGCATFPVRIENSPAAPETRPTKRRRQKHKLPLVRNVPDVAPSKHDAAGILDRLKHKDTHDSHDIHVVASDTPSFTDSPSDCSTDQTTRRLSPQMERSSFQDEAAMLGAFDVWASQTFFEA